MLKQIAPFAVAAALLAGCDNFDASDPTRLEIVNGRVEPIDMVNFSACDAPEFGEDRLAPDEDIAAGAVRDFEVEPGCYDIRIWFAGDTEVRFEEEISEGETFRWEVE